MLRTIIRNHNRLTCKELSISSAIVLILMLTVPLFFLSYFQLSNRVRNQVDQKKRLVSALKANVSEEGQNLFMWLAKMLSNEQVCWSGSDIVIYNNVFIRHPYKPENIESTTHGEQKLLEYVRKLVLNRQEQNNNSSSGASTVSLSTSGV